MAQINRQIRLAARPVGYPKTSDFELVESPLPEPGDGMFQVQTLYLSVDPYQRGRMNEGASYAPGMKIAEVMVGGVVGRVTASRHPEFPVGEIVQGSLGWQEYAVTDGKGVRKVNPDLAPVSTALGILGMPGLTAYFGLLEVGRPKAGETIVISGAAGAVGSLVGQIARIHGCRAVGIAGSSEKVAYLVDDLDFDGAFNYKATEDYGDELRRLCPDGIDVYFDNVGGPITDAVFPLLNEKGRIAVCGQISQYNLEKPAQGPRIMWQFIVKRLTMQGFLVFDFSARHNEALKQMAAWLKAGRLQYREDIVEGIEKAPEAFIGMLKGDNIGKRLVKVA